ncbi:MAG: hypothetical protein KH321_02170, partial [Clostridium sp.]|nr:hypothetical protein [Clostridium sp.]
FCAVGAKAGRYLLLRSDSCLRHYSHYEANTFPLLLNMLGGRFWKRGRSKQSILIFLARFTLFTGVEK